MSRNIWTAVGAAIVGALVVVFYNAIVAPPLPPPVKPTAGPCPGNPHCIPVSVIMVNQAAQIQSIPDEIVNGEAVIRWYITTDGYNFAANGINFVKPNFPPPPNGEITCTQKSNTLYECKDKGDKGTYPYAYTVTVNASGSTVPVTLDPFIINN